MPPSRTNGILMAFQGKVTGVGGPYNFIIP